MLRVTDIRLLPSDQGEMEQLKEQVERRLRQPVRSLQIVKKSLDARRKDDIHYLYTVDVAIADERAYLNHHPDGPIAQAPEKAFVETTPGEIPLKHSPVIVGMGPAGLICGLTLARAGYAPLILEQGDPVEVRQLAVEKFWESGELNPWSNVQFGEGGAGTFSDGKLNTQIKDRQGRIRHCLELLVEAGAPEKILYEAKPHIGTDVLSKVVKNIRHEIMEAGGLVSFNCQLQDIHVAQGQIKEIVMGNTISNELQTLAADHLVLAIGHSARETFHMLRRAGVEMEAKAFALGLRIQHPQSLINTIQYGDKPPKGLPPADYKLTAKASDGRGVYSFCMCPGGYIVNASSQERRLAVNGMSYSGREGAAANAALIVSVTPQDFGSEDPLAGLAYQQRLEEAAWQAGQGAIPVQLWGDFKADHATTQLGEVRPYVKGRWQGANLRQVLPGPLSKALLEAMPQFNRKMKGFDREDALLAGVESRTSSPVRILRDEQLQSNIKGIYPCGEGAGYAGGITSAAVDGLRVAQEIIGRYQPWKKEN